VAIFGRLVASILCVCFFGMVVWSEALPLEYERAFAQSEWVQSPSLRPDFMSGHTFMDTYSREKFDRYLSPTLDSMRASGAAWVIYDNYWTYYSLDPPEISSFGTKPYAHFRDATEMEIAAMIDGAHSRGMRFALMIELNWDGLMGDWQGRDYAQSLWKDSVHFLESKCSAFCAQPSSASVARYWDLWFEAFQVAVIRHAQIAETNSADMLIDWEADCGAVCAGNESRWRNLISEARKHYGGAIGYAAQHTTWEAPSLSYFPATLSTTSSSTTTSGSQARRIHRLVSCEMHSRTTTELNLSRSQDNMTCRSSS